MEEVDCETSDQTGLILLPDSRLSDGGNIIILAAMGIVRSSMEILRFYNDSFQSWNKFGR